MPTSPLRYPGGKVKLYPFFTKLLEANGLVSREYCEPYAGGSGLAIRLLVNGYAERISINDVDESVYAFWRSVFREPDRFCALIEATPVTIDEWHRQKAIWRANDTTDPLSLGFATFFLNRTNRSGIIDGAGPIGGFAQAGDWKLGVRLVKEKQIQNIRQLSKFSKQVEISNEDALAYIDRKINTEGLLYLDPPYYVKGRKLYKNFYRHADHAAIADRLSEDRSANWVVSYDNVEAIRSLYAGFQTITYSLIYSAGPVAIGSEVIFLSDSLGAPQFDGFLVAA